MFPLKVNNGSEAFSLFYLLRTGIDDEVDKFWGKKKKKKLEVLKVNVKSSNSHYRVTWNDRANRSRRADRQSQTGLN